MVDIDKIEACWQSGGVWDIYTNECKFIEETPKKILDDVWKIYKRCGEKPEIEFRRQRRTAVYWPRQNKITIRPDSWNKMHPAERRLTVIHETLHACGIPHREGFRTSQDYASPMIYEHIYGDDFIIQDFKNRIEKSLRKYLRR